MNWGNILFGLTITYHMFIVLDIIFKKHYRDAVKERNKKLEELRNIPIKTIEEQKEFLDIRYGNDFAPIKITWASVLMIIWSIIKFGIIYFIISYLIDYLKIDISLWFAVIIAMIFPILFNLLLKFFGLQQDNNLINVLR